MCGLYFTSANGLFRKETPSQSAIKLLFLWFFLKFRYHNRSRGHCEEFSTGMCIHVTFLRFFLFSRTKFTSKSNKVFAKILKINLKKFSTNSPCYLKRTVVFNLDIILLKVINRMCLKCLIIPICCVNKKNMRGYKDTRELFFGCFKLFEN